MGGRKKHRANKGAKANCEDIQAKDTNALLAQPKQNLTAQNKPEQKHTSESASSNTASAKDSSKSTATNQGGEDPSRVLHGDGVRPAYDSWKFEKNDLASLEDQAAELNRAKERLTSQLDGVGKEIHQELGIRTQLAQALQHYSLRVIPRRELEGEPMSTNPNSNSTIQRPKLAGPDTQMTREEVAKLVTAANCPPARTMRASTQIPDPCTIPRKERFLLKPHQRCPECREERGKVAREMLAMVLRVKELNTGTSEKRGTNNTNFCSYCLQMNKILEDVITRDHVQILWFPKHHEDHLALAKALFPNLPRKETVRQAISLEEALNEQDILKHFDNVPAAEPNHTCMLGSACPVLKKAAKVS